MSNEAAEITEPTLWKKNGWTAKVIKGDDDGWSVAMIRIGDDEPVLVGPWTMGRDKKNPKPLDAAAFATLVKTANEIMLRHEAAARDRLHRSITCTVDDERRVRADLDIAQDDDDPHAILGVFDERSGEELRQGRVSAAFKLSPTTVQRFLKTGE